MAITKIYKGNIVRDDIVKIYKGTTLLYEKALSQGETWLLNETLNETSIEINVSFTAGLVSPVEYMFIARLSHPSFDQLTYQETTTQDYVDYYSGGSWINEDYRTITFETSPTGDLLTWLEANAVKQTGGGGN